MKLAFEFDDMENADEYDVAVVTISKQKQSIIEALSYMGVTEQAIEKYLLNHGYIKPKTEEDGESTN